ncbi:MAG: hypothetical protein R3266_13950, partial [Gemmatimonadota bacterium]|nr:hypothetical protein [Gemmatimonadota bacterium]
MAPSPLRSPSRVPGRAGLAAGLAGLSPAVGLAAQELDERLIRTRCEAVHEIPDQSILYGFVVDGRSGTPLPGSTVYLSWTSVEAGDSTVNRAAAESEDGAYIFCDVPQDTPLTAWAESMGGSSPRSDFLFEGGESARTDLEIRLAAVTGVVTGTLTG